MWIESHQSLRNHPKVKKAARLAGISEPEMIGRLHYLWWWALDYAPDGDISKYSDDDIESAVEWKGESGLFIKSLIECGFSDHCGLIEKVKRGRVIHDWYEYGGKLVERRELNAERMRAKRATHVQNTFDARTPTTEDKIREDNSIGQNTTDSADKPRKRRSNPRSQLPEIQLFRKITNHYPNAINYDEVIEAISSHTEEELTPYYKEWCARNYNAGSIKWLTEWFASGNIPSRNGQYASAPSRPYTSPDNAARLQKAFR